MDPLAILDVSLLIWLCGIFGLAVAAIAVWLAAAPRAWVVSTARWSDRLADQRQSRREGRVWRAAVTDRGHWLLGTRRLVDDGELRAFRARFKEMGRRRPVIGRLGVGPGGQRDWEQVDGVAGEPPRRVGRGDQWPSLPCRSWIVNRSPMRVS